MVLETTVLQTLRKVVDAHMQSQEIYRDRHISRTAEGRLAKIVP